MTIVPSGNKDDGADSHHCVDKVVAEHFQKRWQGVGSYDPEDRFHPVVAHQHRSRLLARRQLSSESFIIRYGVEKIMHHVATGSSEERILQGSSGERQEKRDTNDPFLGTVFAPSAMLEYILSCFAAACPAP